MKKRKRRRSNECKRRMTLFISNNRNLLQIAGYITVLFLLILRQWELVGKPYLWAEDGNIFISRAIDSGFAALTQSYAGYYHFIPQLLTNIFYELCKSINNATMLPHMMWGASIIIAALTIFYFTSEKFSWILEKRADRWIICCLVVLLDLGKMNEVYGTLVNTHWWMGFFFFLVGLSLFHDRKMPSLAITIVLVLCGFSTIGYAPLFAIVSALVFYKIVKRNLLLDDILKFAAISVPIAIQIPSLLLSDRTQGGGAFSQEIITQFIPAFLHLFGKMITPDFFAFHSYLLILVGFGAIGVIFFILRKKKWLMAFTMVYALGIFAFCTWPVSGLHYFFLAGNYGMAGRYWFIASMIMAFIVSVAIVSTLKKIRAQPISVAIAALLFLLIVGRFNIKTLISSNDYMIGYQQFSPLYSNTGTYKLRIPLQSQGWHVSLPSNGYPQERGASYIRYGIDLIDSKPLEDLIVQNEWVSIAGWMYDVNSNTDFEYIMIEIGETYYPMIQKEGKDVTEFYQLPDTADYRFEGMIPRSALHTGENTLNFVAVHADKISYSRLEFIFICTV